MCLTFLDNVYVVALFSLNRINLISLKQSLSLSITANRAFRKM